MLAYTLTLMAANITVLVFCFIKFGPCSFGRLVLILVSIMVAFFYVTSFLKLCDINVFRENWNPFVASTAVTYVVYLCWTTLASVPPFALGSEGPKCYYEPSTKSNIMLQVFVGAAFTGCTVMSIATAARTVANNGDAGTVAKDKTSALGDALAEKVDEEAKADTPEDEESNIFPVTFATVYFQLIMMFASLYFGMLFSNWGDAVDIKNVKKGSFEYDYYAPNFAFIVKFINLVLAIVMLTVSMALGLCCPNRML